VRDTFDLDDRLILVTSDRLSAFDVVFSQGIPDKGNVLNQLSLFWFDKTKHICPNHILDQTVADLPEPFCSYVAELGRRTMIGKKAERVDIECVVRGYLVGSGWKEYKQTQSVCGIPLPEGLQLGSKLPEPIFTPSTKEALGMHDVNISFDKMCDLVGDNIAGMLRDKALAIYNYAADFAEEKGIIIADTKMEFGMVDGSLIIIDELLTPDSSRFWPRESWNPGKNQVSYDKQIIRDYLETLTWDKTPPAPILPEDLITQTSNLYKEIYTILTGKEF
jgi:phosphoribosylaminoimidazole-succinocarboxamide synthase